ncbi:MAG: L-serine ammonia-lyase [Cyclobacteriaceae bacterium]
MEYVSVFDILKIGIGPSSSHTLGPWRAAQKFVGDLIRSSQLQHIQDLKVNLFGSLALTGKGHGTDIAIILGLNFQNPEKIQYYEVKEIAKRIISEKKLRLGNTKEIAFDIQTNIIFNKGKELDYHPNGVSFTAYDAPNSVLVSSTYFSIGGGFVHQEGVPSNIQNHKGKVPYPISNAMDLLSFCSNRSISQVVYQNELELSNSLMIETKLLNIWDVMKESIFLGTHLEGELPGGLKVKKRAPGIRQKLSGIDFESADHLIDYLSKNTFSFDHMLKWIGCFAIAVNEHNADYGRIVTAPTNGSAGVIPAVILYLICFEREKVNIKDILNFLLVAAEIGSLFKKGSTISAAMGGCQAEIGVSSAMAAGALTECLGGTAEQCLMAAEIAMEHHLGLTCDPIGGLVQIPCIERNSMGAIKSIMASKLALESDPKLAKVTLDTVIKTMWSTAQDMDMKYKETSLGGLAVNIPVSFTEC